MSTIIFDTATNLFYLQTEKSSYVMMLQKGAYLMHLYWGRQIPVDDITWSCEPPYRRWSRIVDPEPESDFYTSEYWPFEYPVYGSSDFRPPAIEIENLQGYSLCDLKYRSHSIYRGKGSLQGLPSLGEYQQDRATTLEIVLYDAIMEIDVVLFYSVFDQSDVLCRHSEICNKGDDPVIIRKALSSSIDMKHGNLQMIQFSGTALRERYPVKRALAYGTTSVESTRGISSHIQNPCTLFTRGSADEFQGEAYGQNLMYSGNFIASAHIDQYDSARIQLGLNPFNFSWLLASLNVFTTPETILVYSDQGTNGVSQEFHHALTALLPPGSTRVAERLIGLNTWEACYFDISHLKLMQLAEKAKEAGIELITLDDGWFGRRNDDHSSLGDWNVNKHKFPKGLNAVSEELHQMGLKFGLWLEPEMVSPESDFYNEHPDWCLHIPGRKRTQWRYQLVLDLSKNEVCDYLIEMVSEILRTSGVDYVKWDMNRRLTEVGNELGSSVGQREISHRYILGLYRLLDTLVKRFPNVCFENCASGGGRYDAGMLYYLPQAWPSDNTDPSSRMKILYGSTFGYPLSNFRSHVTDSPNHQLGRRHSLQFREHVATCGILGYELDITKLDQQEIDVIQEHNCWYKQYRSIIQNGVFYRLEDPFIGNKAAFQVVSQDKKTTIFWFFRYRAEPEEAYFQIKLCGLDPAEHYKCLETGRCYHAKTLMNLGLTLPWVNHDDLSVRWTFSRLDD